MSRNGGKHLGSKRRAEIYKREGCYAFNKRKTQEKVASSPLKRLKSRKTKKTPQMIWDDYIKNTPKGCSGNEEMEKLIPKKYRPVVPEKKKPMRTEGYSSRKKGWTRYGGNNSVNSFRVSGK